MSSYFYGLNHKTINNVVIRNMDWNEVYKKCMNYCKVIGNTKILTLQEAYDDDLVRRCMKDCDKVRLDNIGTSGHVVCSGGDVRGCCKEAFGDNDHAYVECLRRHGIRYDILRDRHPIQRQTLATGGDTSGFEVVHDRYLFPDSGIGFSCADAIGGECIEDLSVKECVETCAAHPDLCSFGYHVRLKPSGKSYCLPLLDQDLGGGSIMDYSFPPDDFDLAKTYDSTVFYKKDLRRSSYDLDRPFYIHYRDTYLDENLHWVGQKNQAALFSMINMISNDNIIRDRDIVYIHLYKTVQVIAFSLHDGPPLLLPVLNITDSAVNSVDMDNYTIFIQINMMSADHFTLKVMRGAVDQHFVATDRSLLGNVITTTKGLRLGKENATPLRFEFQDMRPTPPFEKVYEYYRRFWEQQPRRRPWWSITVVVLAIIAVAVAVAVIAGLLAAKRARRRKR